MAYSRCRPRFDWPVDDNKVAISITIIRAVMHDADDVALVSSTTVHPNAARTLLLLLLLLLLHDMHSFSDAHACIFSTLHTLHHA